MAQNPHAVKSAATEPTLAEGLATLRGLEAELKASGVLHAAVFGSVSRGEARPSSDVDVVVELDPSAGVGLIEFVGIRDLLVAGFGRPVDVLSRRALREPRDSEILRDAKEAF